MNNNESMTAHIGNEKIIIEIPIDFIVITQKYRGYYPYKILDKKL